MTQHYPRNTVWASSWCRVCNGFTPHRIDDARVGPCLTCLEKLQQWATNAEAPAEDVKAAQGNLFGGEA